MSSQKKRFYFIVNWQKLILTLKRSPNLQSGITSFYHIGRWQVGVQHDLPVRDLDREVGPVQVVVQLPGQDPGDELTVLRTAKHLKNMFYDISYLHNS